MQRSRLQTLAACCIFVLVGARTIDELAERQQHAPPDLRCFEVVAPEDEQRTRKAAATLSRFKKSAADEVSRRKRLDDLKVLGRGTHFNHGDPAEVKTAIHQFLHGARSRMAAFSSSTETLNLSAMPCPPASLASPAARR